MVKRNPKNKLEKWEVAIVKAMVAAKTYADQEIVAYFSRPSRSINQGRIADIKKGKLHRSVKAASAEEMANFLSSWPLVDYETGLDLLADELLIKAREAMLLAVQSYNSPKTFFRAEVFIVTAIIAWTYLMHAFYKVKGIDYRHHEIRDGKRVSVTTKYGAAKTWELARCVEHAVCPLDKPTRANLAFLIEIRHEIEHQMTQRIDQALSAKLQACCLNFNRVLTQLFGERLRLDRELSVALQFVTFSFDQNKALIKEQTLPTNVQAAQKAIEDELTEEEFNDPRYAFRVAFVQKTVSNKGTADQVVEFIKPDSEEAKAINRVLLKEVEKVKFKPKQVVRIVQREGYPKFNMHHHTE
jgi:hypothetical protein